MKNQGVRILIVDDEKAIRRFLKASLASHGYAVIEAASGTDALEKSVSFHPDVVVLDLGLPDMDGVEVIREVRKRAKTPIIILSVRDEVNDKVAALDAGADDYLTKPFSITELLARLKAVMRRLLPADQEEIFRVGALSMDAARHRVTVKADQIDLTPTEYDILKLLVLNAGRIVTHKQILEEVWNKPDDMEGALHLLRVTISNLRSKIEPDPDRPTYVLTEPGIGYRLRSAA
ncbi:MAG: response regulator transcription factor [Candidatus Krumholzibacteria bacterium]|nr:response regulator transcription factor [Candidatus Krumholzibacteria bacterium]